MAADGSSAAVDFEQERARRIAENRKRMEEMGLLKHSNELSRFLTPQKPTTVRTPTIRKERSRSATAPPRRSGRLSGVDVAYHEVDENDRVTVRAGTGIAAGLLDLMDRSAQDTSSGPTPEPNQDAFRAIQEARCASQGRGSVYDSNVGTTCHFCRQKKLCGEEACPRCSRRDSSKQCIGKTECARCMSAMGRFCRACLLLRYGQRLEDARAQDDEGGNAWLCPHCYEEENPDEGWICNSSICMTKRGLRPTGIAIFNAHERGYRSVAHLLQATLKKGGVATLLQAAAGVNDDVDPSPAPVAPRAPSAQDAAPPPSGTGAPFQQTSAGGKGQVMVVKDDDDGDVDMRTRLRSRKRAMRGVEEQPPSAIPAADTTTANTNIKVVQGMAGKAKEKRQKGAKEQKEDLQLPNLPSSTPAHTVWSFSSKSAVTAVAVISAVQATLAKRMRTFAGIATPTYIHPNVTASGFDQATLPAKTHEVVVKAAEPRRSGRHVTP